MRQEIEIDKNQLVPGQHIFAYRALGSFSHHGIYVGRDSKKWHVQYVIHFMITGAIKSGSIFGSSIFNSQKCEDCNYRTNVDDGVVRTCLNCFIGNGGSLGGTKLYLYQYGVSPIEKLISAGGTCSCQPAKPLEEIVKIAYERLNNPKSRSYDLLTYNCETFATECSTGQGESGQVTKPPLLGPSLFCVIQ